MINRGGRVIVEIWICRSPIIGSVEQRSSE